jgi:hypothetical protein
VVLLIQETDLIFSLYQCAFYDKKIDGDLKNPDAALRCILRHCGVHKSTPHSSGFVRLACGTF